MEPGPLGIIGYPDGRIREGRENLDRLDISRPGIGGRDHPETTAMPDKLFQIIENQPDPAPFDERDKKVDAVSGLDLLSHLIHETGLFRRPGKEAALRDGGLWPRGCNDVER
ncbi:hypothetical protein DSECCO2_518430 [anaerobic digester metagenome]